eukprot:627064-Amphidinium_carterae.1
MQTVAVQPIPCASLQVLTVTWLAARAWYAEFSSVLLGEWRFDHDCLLRHMFLGLGFQRSTKLAKDLGWKSAGLA